MGAWTERHMAKLHERVEIELDAIGTEMVDDVQEACNTPVEYTGNGVIRSEWGEDPRREFGHLWTSFFHRIESTVALVIGNSAHYARKLHNDLNRPFFTHLKARWDSQVGQRVLDAILGKR